MSELEMEESENKNSKKSKKAMVESPESSSSPSPAAAAAAPMVALSDDLLLQILGRLEGDPRDWARVACVSPRLAGLLRAFCFRSSLSRHLPAELLPPPSPSPSSLSSWATLQKLSVCCPGLLRAGVLLEHSDFGLERDIGPDMSFLLAPDLCDSKNSSTDSSNSKNSPPIRSATADSKNPPPDSASSSNPTNPIPTTAETGWSLFDDLFLDAAYDRSEAQNRTFPPEAAAPAEVSAAATPARAGIVSCKSRKRQWLGPVGAHLASGSWSLSREQGHKLLASRLRGDCLYICDWPGCVHAEEKRKYMVFRGVFKNFKRSQVWRSIRDSHRGTVQLECAFCACKETWDLHSAFCLRSFFGFHDDGEPVVRAYVCENGHVSGAWTERPMYA